VQGDDGDGCCGGGVELVVEFEVAGVGPFLGGLVPEGVVFGGVQGAGVVVACLDFYGDEFVVDVVV
jgi:hypothetical protein